MVTVGVDIGGSGLRAARVMGGCAGPMVRLDTIGTTCEELIERVAEGISTLGAADAIGVAVPGFVRDGVLLAAPNAPQLDGAPLARLLSERLGAPVALINDANAAALGAWAELSQGDDLVLLTLGTGVGGGVVLSGRALVGASGTGGELGHMHIGGKMPCGCGALGCLETWVGTAGLRRRAARLGYDLSDGEQLVALADAGELWAQGLLHDASNALGYGLRTLLNIFGCRRVVITGGLAAAQMWLRPGAERHLATQGIPSNVEGVEIIWRAGAAHWAVLGAAHEAVVALRGAT